MHQFEYDKKFDDQNERREEIRFRSIQHIHQVNITEEMMISIHFRHLLNMNWKNASKKCMFSVWKLRKVIHSLSDRMDTYRYLF